MTCHGEALIRTLYEDYGEMLLAYAARLTNDRTAAEDIVRDTLIRARRHPYALVSRDGSVRSWLLSVAHDIAFGRVVDDHGGEASPERLGFIVLEPVPESAARARRWFRKLMTGHDLACSIDDCLLLISELVTNAITYGRADGDWSVRVEWWRDGDALRVEVHNPAAGSPLDVELRRCSADDEHGRGLELVAALADCWAVESSQFTGTRVTFTLNNAWKFNGDH
ncbi:ATP-binding protein [Streptomyces sp. 7N604]|uniref:ATP-binding protein n=1 Tax=Streptomyces sp. 7N604 TaxID=3457415 RepID=UPI003FD67DFE